MRKKNKRKEREGRMIEKNETLLVREKNDDRTARHCKGLPQHKFELANEIK